MAFRGKTPNTGVTIRRIVSAMALPRNAKSIRLPREEHAAERVERRLAGDRHRVQGHARGDGLARGNVVRNVRLPCLREDAKPKAGEKRRQREAGRRIKRKLAKDGA